MIMHAPDAATNFIKLIAKIKLIMKMKIINVSCTVITIIISVSHTLRNDQYYYKLSTSDNYTSI